MPGVKPFFIEARIVDVPPGYNVAYAKVVNGNVYTLRIDTPGIDVKKLKKDQLVEIEITEKLIRVLSARIID